MEVVRDKLAGRDTSKTLLIKANGKELFNSKYQSFLILQDYLNSEVLDEYIGKNVHALNIKLKMQL